MTSKDNPTTLLLVEDEPSNIKIVRNDLEDEPFELLTATDGQEGWEVLQANKERIRIILLDRMMPNMDGMAFMKQLKADEQVAHIPVIMQTAAAEKQQIIEGINAGVYYYLTKPYQKDMLLSILYAALKDRAIYDRLAEDLAHFRRKLKLVKESTFEIRDLEDAEYLTTFLANHYPDPARVSLGIWELLLNALEHGHAGIDYEEKSRLLEAGNWETEVRTRLAAPEVAAKAVLVHFRREADAITLSIADQGGGFDWEQYLEISPERATHSHGRGIALARRISFDSLEFQGNGSKVVCRVVLRS